MRTTIHPLIAASAAEIVRIWKNWSDDNEADSEIALRDAARCTEGLVLSMVDGDLARALEYFAAAHLHGHNPDDLTICQMVDNLETAIAEG